MKKHFLISLIVLLLFSCSREKSTVISRAYHNTTSRYNGYFNARELLKKNEANLRTQQVDDYTQLLPIFIIPDEQKSQSMYPDMDLIIEKCSEVIERHSMYIKRKEHVKWIDDSYLLIAKARYYKYEFGLAEETNLYVYQAFKKSEQRYEGLVGLIRTYIETRDWDKAEEFIDLAEDERKKFPEELLGHYYATVADYHIKKDYDVENAILNIEEAIKYEKEKYQRRRLTYILAQLYQERREYSRATNLYSKVLKMNPEYVMRFNARISRAIAYDVSTAGSEDIKKELRKMLKDAKNEEFKDQIYYALAEIALKEDDEPQAIDYLRKSTKFSVNNNRQKGLSYLKLADIYFDQPSYVNAQAHYDSTIQYLPKDHPEYYEAESKNNSLQELVKNLKVIDRLDSLLALAQLNEKDREKKVKKIVADIKKRDEEQKQAKLNALRRQQELSTNQGIVNNATSRGKGKWYFYNATTMSLGLNEFNRVWGDRTLEDNWRRKNKNSTVVATENNQDGGANLAEAKEEEDESKYDINEYLKNIPVDMKEQLEAHGQIAEALFNVGTIFKESFQDKPSAVKSFTRVINQYDTSKFNLPSHYQLYRIYFLEGNSAEADVHKAWILDNHPFSEYAYLIKNPDYNKESKETKEKIEEYYEATYKLYAYGLYSDVIESCEKAEKVFKKNHIQAKFDFLKAKAIGHTKSKEDFKLALEKIVQDYPEDSIKLRAEYILNYMNNMGKGNAANVINSNQLYKYKPDEQHFFIMSLQEGNANSRKLKLELANFNQTNFREKKLDFTTSSLPQRTLYLIRTFDNEMDVMRYFSSVKNNARLQVEIQAANAKPYIISLSNFRTLFKEKNEQVYLEFFNKKYPG